MLRWPSASRWKRSVTPRAETLSTSISRFEQQRLQAQRQRGMLDAGEGLLRLATLGQAHALHGHRRLRPQLQRDGPVESQFARMVGSHPVDGHALEVLGIEAEQQPRRHARQQQQQRGQHVQASTPQGPHGELTRSAWWAFSGGGGMLHDDCAIGRIHGFQRGALLPAGAMRSIGALLAPLDLQLASSLSSAGATSASAWTTNSRKRSAAELIGWPLRLTMP